MPQSNVTTWLDFALQQMAAESYLDGVALSDDDTIIERLKLGNNNPLFNDPDNPNLSGRTRFVDLSGVANAVEVTGSAQAFVARYDIVGHHADDATGFSATLLKDTTTNTYTLSFRSLEYALQANGGDFERDAGPGASGEIGRAGFAFAQLVSMERYYRELTADPTKLPAGAVLNVTGYSLGGHLATVFTELHYQDANIQFGQTTTFNAAGRGRIVEQGQVGQPEDQSTRRMLQDVEARILAFDPTGALFQSGAAGNIYTDQRYADAVDATRQQFVTTGTNDISAFPVGGGLFGGVTSTAGGLSKITQVFGQALTGSDAQIVANSGVHGTVQAVLIEGQPLLEGQNEQQRYEFGNSHSITLLVDSLALQELFQTVDPNVPQAQIEGILKAASAATSDTFATQSDEHVAEGDTLEKALDGLRKVFIDAGAPSTGFNDDTGGFGNLTFRNEFYTHLAEVKTQLATTFAGQTFRIQSLVGQPSNDIRTAAEGMEPTSLAYRFALKELNPFVVLGSNDTTTQTLYDRHNQTGELALVNPETGVGELTPQYLIDRAAFLAKKMEVNSNASSGFNFTHFHDNPSGYDIAPTLTLRQMVFGDGTNETLTGGTGTDHFYGGSGDDQLLGLENNDYLEGNRGDDTLDGGSGADTMLGGQGNDTYIVDNVGDVVREYTNSGIDLVRSSVTFTLDSQVENLTLTGTDAIDGTGNELNNLLIGNDKINRLEGNGGQDTLQGGIGNDILIGGPGDNDLLEGGAGFDTYIYKAGDGTIRIEDDALKLALTR